MRRCGVLVHSCWYWCGVLVCPAGTGTGTTGASGVYGGVWGGEMVVDCRLGEGV